MPAPPPHGSTPDLGGDLFDYALLRNYLGFTLRAARRRIGLALACFVAVVALAAALVLATPRTYRAQAVIIALRNPVVSALSNPGMYRPYESDAPTRAARETILRRDNLIALCDQTRLVESWQASRAPLVRFADAALRIAKGRDRTREELVEALVDRLETRLSVNVTEGTVTIGLEWPDAQGAYEIVQAAMQNFLEARQSTEISMVEDAIGILEVHAGTLQRQIDGAVERLSERERAARRERPTAARVTAAARPRPHDQELATLRSFHASKRRALADVEEFRRRRIAELQAQLAQQQATYAEAHPAIAATRESIAALAGSSPQLESLRRDVQELERDILRLGGSIETAEAPMAALETLVPFEPQRDATEDPRLEYERTRLRMLFQSYANVLERIDAVRVEMHTAQAAFKYRYGIFNPPQLPKHPVWPKIPLVAAAALLGGLLFALFSTALVDVRSGRLLETWQVERQLGVPVLAEIRA